MVSSQRLSQFSLVLYMGMLLLQKAQNASSPLETVHSPEEGSAEKSEEIEIDLHAVDA